MKGKVLAVGGLVLIGAGLSMVVDAGNRRAEGNKWFLYGTVALLVFNSGLSLVAGSARYPENSASKNQ